MFAPYHSNISYGMATYIGGIFWIVAFGLKIVSISYTTINHQPSAARTFGPTLIQFNESVYVSPCVNNDFDICMLYYFDGLPFFFFITFISMSSMHVINKYFKMDNHKCRWIRKRVSVETFGIDTWFFEVEISWIWMLWSMCLCLYFSICRLWLCLLLEKLEWEMKIENWFSIGYNLQLDIRKMYNIWSE